MIPSLAVTHRWQGPVLHMACAMCFSVELWWWTVEGLWMFVELWKPAPCGSRGLFATLLCIMTVASIGLLAWCLRDVLQHMHIFEQQGLDLKSTICGSVTELVQQMATNCNPIWFPYKLCHPVPLRCIWPMNTPNIARTIVMCHCSFGCRCIVSFFQTCWNRDWLQCLQHHTKMEEIIVVLSRKLKRHQEPRSRIFFDL